MPILLNWIWQGSALTCLVALVVCRRRALNAATRERIWWATLGAVCVMPLISTMHAARAAGLAVEADAAPLVLVAEPSGAVLGTAWLIWTLWLTISVVRLLGALVSLVGAKRSAAPFPSERLAGLPAWHQVSLQGRQPTLVVSDRVSSAGVLGLGRPMIAVSPLALEQLNDEELDGILVHEYGHVRRRDDLGVLLQGAVRAVFGLHPAVWWLDRALTFEREVACDDVVLAEARSTPQRYARSLVKLVEQIGARRELRLAPGATFGRPQLTRRIVRLLDRQRNASVRPSRPTVGLAITAIAILVLVTLSVELVALAAPTLVSRRMAAGLIQPFLHAGLAPGLSVAWTTETAIAEGRQVSPARPAASGGGDGPLSEQALEVPAAIGAASSESSGSELLPAARLDPTLVLPVSGPASPGVQGRGSDTTTAVGRPQAPSEGPMPWTQAADAASAIGRGSRESAIKTARLFTRIGKSAAGAF